MDKLIKTLSKFAEKGDVDAMQFLGRIHFDLSDYKVAFRYFDKAAVRGCTPALFQMGIMYRDGLGVEKNHAKAMDHLMKSGVSEDEAQLLLGY